MLHTCDRARVIPSYGAFRAALGTPCRSCLLVHLKFSQRPRHSATWPKRALMRPSQALAWASHTFLAWVSQTFCDSETTCQTNSVPISCGPASPIYTAHKDGVAIAKTTGCGVAWCGVPKVLLQNGNGQDALHAKREGWVSQPCVVCFAPMTGHELSLSRQP